MSSCGKRLSTSHSATTHDSIASFCRQQFQPAGVLYPSLWCATRLTRRRARCHKSSSSTNAGLSSLSVLSGQQTFGCCGRWFARGSRLQLPRRHPRRQYPRRPHHRPQHRSRQSQNERPHPLLVTRPGLFAVLGAGLPVLATRRRRPAAAAEQASALWHQNDVGCFSSFGFAELPRALDVERRGLL